MKPGSTLRTHIYTRRHPTKFSLQCELTPGFFVPCSELCNIFVIRSLQHFSSFVGGCLESFCFYLLTKYRFLLASRLPFLSAYFCFFSFFFSSFCYIVPDLPIKCFCVRPRHTKNILMSLFSFYFFPPFYFSLHYFQVS